MMTKQKICVIIKDNYAKKRSAKNLPDKVYCKTENFFGRGSTIMSRRILSIFTALMLCVSMLPLPAIAENVKTEPTAVQKQEANGVLNGTGNNTFSPDDVITREQIAAIFYRYAESKGLNMTVSESWREALKTDNDYTEIADYAKSAVEWCYEHHILFTYSLDGYAYSICPKAAPTRAETATLFYNFDYELNHS